MDPWSFTKYKLQNFQEKQHLTKYFENLNNLKCNKCLYSILNKINEIEYQIRHIQNKIDYLISLLENKEQNECNKYNLL